MKRALFVAGAVAGAFLPLGVLAASPLTIVCATCSNGDGDVAEQAEDKISGALIDRGVTVADPSAIQERYREQGRAAIARVWGGMAMAWESVSWVERTYHGRRLLAVQVVVTDSSLPYGEFTVHQIKTRLSYKCFDVTTHQMIAAGSNSAKSRGEDVTDVTDQALESAVRTLAASAANRMKG
ncbi:MAG: hypothetical protein IAI50_01740 [Candidatus Eremiobacteraeota bacterium]|nr:hypothetical protein [Candidatus Eremiobacteraeota bacterium]